MMPTRHAVRIALLSSVMVPTDAIITMDAVKRSTMTCFSCVCIFLCLICAGFILYILWGQPPEEEDDPWADYEDIIENNTNPEKASEDDSSGGGFTILFT